MAGLGHCPKPSRASGHRYGVARVWRMPRSSFYAAGKPETDVTPAAVSPARRGPKPAVSDDALLAAIRADLERSPWAGEGHRKVWARLRAIAPSECRASVCCG